MLNRQKARELAMQVLFLWDAHGSNDTEMALHAIGQPGAPDVDDDVRRAALSMAEGAWGQREASDQWVERLAPQWPPRRQPPVDRNILRLGIWEMTNTVTPAKVVIDEAIELARQFSTEQSPAFINGVLDAAHKENRALKEGSGFGVQGSGGAH
jgi:transcription antitermination protein NusB